MKPFTTTRLCHYTIALTHNRQTWKKWNNCAV